MANSTRADQFRRRLWLVGVAAVIALGSGWVESPGARADGDPASDVLAFGSLYLPQDAGATVGQQSELAALLRAAQGSGWGIHVAIVASRTDLGSVTELWRQPDNYARFLGQELELLHRGPLLVVMPDGFGLYGGPVAAERSTLAGVETRAGLVPRTIAAVERLATAAGHPLASVGTSAQPPRSGPVDVTAWIAFAAGCVLVALAWTVSLRERPLRSKARTGGKP